MTTQLSLQNVPQSVTNVSSLLQLIADSGVAQNLEIVSNFFQFRPRRTRIFMGFTISTVLLPGTNGKSHG